MSSDRFVRFVEPYLDQGHHEILHLMKMLVYGHAPALFDLLDFDDDGAFLEPLLFAFFNTVAPPVGLEQILFGYIADDRKPAATNVATDHDGVVYLPKVGYLVTDCCDRSLVLTWE